jgi:hypothetical protein
MTDDLNHAADCLADLLTLENDALAALDLPRAGAMVADKQAAIDSFTRLHMLTPDAPESRGIVERLQPLATRNRDLLERALLVQSQVIGIVARAMPRAGHAGGRYGADGEMAAPRRAIPVAIAARV